MRSDGFSLTELMVTLGVSGMLMLFAHSILNKVNKESSDQIERSERAAGKLILEKVIRKDLRMADISFNRSSQEDDNGNIFFDYLPHGGCSSGCERSITIEIDSDGDLSEKVYFLIENAFHGVKHSYAPSNAFSSGLNFVSLNNNDALEREQFSPWEEGELLYVYSPIPVYQSEGGSSTIPPRYIDFLGKVPDSDQSLDEVDFEHFINKDARDGATISSEEYVLLNAPYTHGLANKIYIKQAKLVTYQLEGYMSGGELKGRLIRAELLADDQWKQTVLNNNVSKVVFQRNSINLPTVSISFDKGI